MSLVHMHRRYTAVMCVCVCVSVGVRCMLELEGLNHFVTPFTHIILCLLFYAVPNPDSVITRTQSISVFLPSHTITSYTLPALTATTTGQVLLCKLQTSNNGMFICFFQLKQLTQQQQ